MDENIVITPENTTLEADGYVKRDEFVACRNEIDVLKEEVEDIRDNHLNSIEAWILNLADEVSHLRWFIIASAGVIAIVLTILQVFG